MLILTQDEKERAVNRSRRMYQTDMDSNIATAEQRGEKKGEKEARITVARNMMKRNRPIDEIIKDTGLTREEVELSMSNASSPDVCLIVSQEERECAIDRSHRIRPPYIEPYVAPAEARGEKKGEKKGRIAVAQNMIKRNRPINEIIEDTGLLREVVEKL